MNTDYHINDINQIATKLLSNSKYNTYLFNADMGAGKTTLITAMCRQLGVTDPISSPTFAIVNHYQNNQSSIYHFDLYRLKNEQELTDLGFEDYLDPKAYLFIEWPEIAVPYLQQYSLINITTIDQSHRHITMSTIN